MPVVTQLDRYWAHKLKQSIGCLMMLREFVIDYAQCCALHFAYVCCLIEFQHLTAQGLNVAELPFHVFHEVCLAAIHRNMLPKAAGSDQCRW